MEATTNATTKTTYLRETTLRYGKKVKAEPMKDPEAVARLFRKVVKDNTREHFVAFYLDGAHEVVGYSVAHVGTANACVAHPREVFRPAVLAGACAVVVAHNHPSGCLVPSEEDRRVSAGLAEAGQVLGIKLLDSVLVTDEQHLSILA